MKQLIIEQADVFVVGPDTERCRLAADMGEVFETLTVLRLQTRCGLEGVAGITTYSEHNWDTGLAGALRPLLPGILGKDARDSEAIWQHCMSRYNSMTPKPQSAIDIALWDLQAKAAGQPLYRYLGGNRDQIEAYASTPLLDSPQEYVEFVRTLQAEGHRTIKFHVWCDLERDLALLEAIDDAFGSDLPFMIDLEERYSYDDALTIARRLESMNCIWLEAPLPDTDLNGYAELRQQTDTPILPAGNTLTSPELMQFGLDANAWDAMRTDVTYAGGFTAARSIAALAQQQGKSLELQSWGYTLSQAANLHLMLSIDNSRYFEQPVPYTSHEAGSQTVIRTEDSQVQAPDGPGLGIEVDWPAVRKHAVWHYSEAL